MVDGSFGWYFCVKVRLRALNCSVNYIYAYSKYSISLFWLFLKCSSFLNYFEPLLSQEYFSKRDLLGFILVCSLQDHVVGLWFWTPTFYAKVPSCSTISWKYFWWVALWAIYSCAAFKAKRFGLWPCHQKFIMQMNPPEQVLLQRLFDPRPFGGGSWSNLAGTP